MANVKVAQGPAGRASGRMSIDMLGSGLPRFTQASKSCRATGREGHQGRKFGRGAGRSSQGMQTLSDREIHCKNSELPARQVVKHALIITIAYVEVNNRIALYLWTGICGAAPSALSACAYLESRWAQGKHGAPSVDSIGMGFRMKNMK